MAAAIRQSVHALARGRLVSSSSASIAAARATSAVPDMPSQLLERVQEELHTVAGSAVGATMAVGFTAAVTTSAVCKVSQCAINTTMSVVGLAVDRGTLRLLAGSSEPTSNR